MNKILITALLAIITISCKQQPQEQPTKVYQEKYPYGTVMYAKPDSIKVVIQAFDSRDNTYKAYWREGANYTSSWYSEEGFYGEVQTSINTSDE